MREYNCNRPVKKVLMDAARKRNHKRNRLLFIVIVISVGVILTIFSLVYGKMQIDIHKNIRTDGMAVSTYVENGTEDMALQLTQLSYITEIGKEKFAGKLLNDSIKYCDCIIADSAAFKKMISPAFTNIMGTYPQQKNEIMLSTKTLQYLGVRNPKVGMEIELDFYWNDIFHTNGTGKQIFLLSGFFTEHQNQTSNSSVAFLSEERMKKDGVYWDSCRILIDLAKKYSSGMRVENMLENDIKLKKNQRIVSMDSAEYRAVTGMLGSYGFAVLFSVIVLLCMFLFIYNILNISWENDLQRYGLLEVIGVKQQQIIHITNCEIAGIGLAGSVVGGILGEIFVWGIMPLLLEKMYAEYAWELEEIVLFQPKLILIAIAPVIFTLEAASTFLKRKMRKLSPLECMNYTEAFTYKKNVKKQKVKKVKNFCRWGKHPESYLAKKYLFRNKKTFWITLLSLWGGCELALCSAVIVSGVDLQNYYRKEPDFQIGITEEGCNYLIESPLATNNMEFFSKDIMDEVEIAIGKDFHSIKRMKGFYPIVGKNGKENIRILSSGDGVPTVIQVISAGEEEKLRNYIQVNSKMADWEQFQNSHGAIILHDHRMSEYVSGQIPNYIGSEMEFYNLVPVGTEMSGLVPVKLANCGYLDITEDHFPAMELCWNGKNINILLVTESTYDWLTENLTPQIFEMQVYVDENREAIIRGRLKQIIQNYNMEFQSEYGCADKLNLFYLDSKSELLLKEKNYIQISRWMMISISGVLIFIGIMNFANARVADIILRKQECMIMESVGMTKKQQYRMFAIEGIFWWLIICGMLMTLGNLGIGMIQWYMKIQIPYFVFNYPIKEMITLMVLLLLFSVFFPRTIYKMIKK